MAGETPVKTSTTGLSYDRKKFLAATLLQRTHLKLVASSICDKEKQEKGTGAIAYFVRYKRMFVPMTALSEGVDPADSTIELEELSVTLDQWGDVLTITDLAVLETSHPLLQQCMELLSDNAQRVIDREVQIVWMAGTNVQYGDGSVTSRATITTSMKVTDAVITKARVTLVAGGAMGRSGPANAVEVGRADAASTITGGNQFVGICGAQVMGDIMNPSTSLGTWAAVQTYNNAKASYNSEVGSWLNIRWVETNFIPQFTMLGSTTAAVASGNAFGTDTPVVTAVDGGGSLGSSATFFYKVTRKDKTRGFEEAISVAHSTASAATSNNESFTFNFSSLTAGYVYNLYFDSVAGGGTGTDATLKLVTANIAVGTTVTVTAVATGATAPANVNTTGTPTIHVVYIHGSFSCVWVGLQDLEVITSGDVATPDNPLKLRKTIGYKFMGKTMIKNQSFMLRLEVASAY